MSRHHQKFVKTERDTSTLRAEKQQRQEASRQAVRSGVLTQDDLFLVPRSLAKSLRIHQYKA